MKNKEKLYIAQEDLFRHGNAGSSLISRVRDREVDIIKVNGIKTIIANGKGISLYNRAGLDKRPLSG